jgi:polysaccharide chain length determinant protein (PEP-CTERM system associated)
VAEGETKPVEFERLLAVWRRRKWLAAFVFILPFTAGLSLILSLPNLYRATATVLVERQQVPESFVKATVTSEFETRLQTISQEILSRARLLQLIKQFHLYSDMQGSMSNDQLADRMRRDIQIEIRSARPSGPAATIAFALSYRGRDPHTVALVTNTLASFYAEENLKIRERQASGTSGFLKAQLETTRKRLDDQERVVSDFKRRHLGELPQQMMANFSTLESLNTQLRLNNDNLVRAEERRDTFAAQLAEAEASGQLSEVPMGRASGPEPPATQLTRLRQELIAAQARYTDAHPTVTRLKEEIASVERDLANARAEAKVADAKSGPPRKVPVATSPYVLRLREGLNAADAEVRIAKAEDQRLRNAIGSYQTRVETAPRREQEYLDLSREYDSTKELYASLLKRYEEAQIAENMEQRQKGELFRLLDSALASGAVVTPNRLFLLLAILGISAGAAVGAAFLAELLDTSFHFAGDLSAVTRVPVLVRIPWIRTEAYVRRRRQRLQLVAVGTVLSLALVATASYFVAHENEQLVRMLDRERA